MNNIIVIGASAGGVEALRTIARGLPADFRAAVFIVLHISADTPSILPDLLDQVGPLTARAACDGEAIKPGRIYTAPSDFHLALDHGRVRVYRGPRENRHRPAIDPLFRSAAKLYGPRVAGVILTGQLDDGAAGLQTIKQLGGVAIVQDPSTAEHRGMPENAIKSVRPDYILPVGEMAPLLIGLAGDKWSEEAAVGVAQNGPLQPNELIPDSTNNGPLNSDPPGDALAVTGAPSVYSCPECHGTLWELGETGLLRFRCRVGHAYSSESMALAQSESAEAALWTALRSLEESAALEERMADRLRQTGGDALAARYELAARSRRQHADVIRKMIAERTV